MKPLTLQQVRQAVNGKPLTILPEDAAAMIRAITTNSKEVPAGSLFIAIKGERHDAHAYVADAGRNGAVAALVERLPEPAAEGVALIAVLNSRLAMGKLARFVRQQMTGTVITVSGANGKTTTKNLIDAALRPTLRGTISPKSFNNDIGVPLAIFAADASQDYLVLEVGTNHHGEIKPLAQIAQPDIAVVTNVGIEHLEGLGDLAGVRREEACIIQGLAEDGCLIVNGDDAEFIEAVSGFRGQRVTFGFKPTNDLYASDIVCTERGVQFRLNNSRRSVFIPLLGRHNACNALAAIAASRKMGLSEESIIQNLAVARGPEMRMELSEVRGITLINDAYNANPTSMRASLDTLTDLPTTGRRIAVLGDMLELGEATRSYHEEIGRHIAAQSIDHLICVGRNAQIIAKLAEQNGMPAARIETFPDAASAAANFPERLAPGDLVLLKGSRGIGLERLAKTLLDASAVADNVVTAS